MLDRRLAITLMTTAVKLTALALLSSACGSELRRFPLAEPVLEDPDRNHVEQRPEPYTSPFYWDAIDNSTFRPMSRFFAVDPAGPSVNVNALDEVPNSSWFENRIGLGGFSVEQARRGSCPEHRIDTTGPWVVTGAKTEGANPGFFIRAPDGRRYLLKFDGTKQPQRATSADVFGSRLYYAAGFHAPCNFIVFFDPQILELDPEAEAEDARGNTVPMTEAHVQQVLDTAFVLEDGRLRASASLFLDGRPLGPWRYEGIREDDPNDAIPHEDRRELRGGRLLAAWINHFDAREANTLSMWVEDDHAHYVMHYYIDFGDSFGSQWDWDQLSRRLGHAYYFDYGDVMADFLALGAIPRPWHQVSRSEVAPVFGYFEAAHFDPEEWRTGYPNPAFSRMDEPDAAWMARILAHVTDAHVRAMLDEARITVPAWDAELYRILLARRDRILEAYLPIRSPLTHFEVQATESGAARLCGVDLAVQTGLFDANTVRYQTRMYFGDFDRPRWERSEPLSAGDETGALCIGLEENGLRPALEAADAAADSVSRYAVVDILVVPEPGAEPTPPARLHFYDLGEAGFRLVGIERPADDDPPGNE
jgi:hypothetical protein